MRKKIENKFWIILNVGMWFFVRIRHTKPGAKTFFDVRKKNIVDFSPSVTKYPNRSILIDIGLRT